MTDGEPLIRWSWVADHLDEIWGAFVQHLWLTFVAVGVGFIISLPLGLLSLRHRWFEGPISWATAILYAIPSLAAFVLLVPFTGLTFLTAEIALVSYTLQILTRTMVTGIRSVPDAVVDSASGMGYGRARRLAAIELPLALPVIIAGVRVATVTTVGLVPISGLLGSDQGGLGQLIFDGLRRFFPTPLIIGAVLTVVLAVTLDLLLVGAQHILTPWARAGDKAVEATPTDVELAGV